MQLAAGRDGRWLSYLLQYPSPHWREISLSGLGVRLSPPGQLAAANCCAAGLSLVEGIGFLMGQRRAIWLTLLVTGALLPLQVSKLADRIWWSRLLFLAVNLAIVYVLLVRLRRDRRPG